MRPMNMKSENSKTQLLLALMVAVALFLTPAAFAAAPGIMGTTFSLTAQPAYLNQPDGEAVYSWGYGCASTSGITFVPAAITNAVCNSMQVPGPTLVVNENDVVTVKLTNNLPTPAGNTSILFPGFKVTATGGVAGLLTQEAAPGATVTYTFTASAPGTHPYYSGTQGDLQVEMGMYGALIVLPANVPANCTTGEHADEVNVVKPHWGESDFRLASAAYDHPASCYDREYLVQWATIDPRIHHQAEAESADPARVAACTTSLTAPLCGLDVQTEPYHPSYFVINGRSMPDLMDPNYAAEYPHQPYNANPHTHPGDLLLIRAIGQGRWQHPFHEHANHVRILARDGNLILSSVVANATGNTITYGTPGSTPTAGPPLAGLLMFNTDTTPGDAFDGIFYFTGRGLNWDPYGHHPGDTADPLASLPCYPDADGYNTGYDAVSGTLTHPEVRLAVNYFEWCQDHNKPVQVNPFGDVAAGGPVTLPDPNILTNGAWYGGTPYLGPDASLRASMPTCVGSPYGTSNPPNAGCTTLLPSNTQANPASERGWAFMWHSHNEREITTNNVFPGGMLMMLLVDSREFAIDEGL